MLLFNKDVEQHTLDLGILLKDRDIKDIIVVSYSYGRHMY